MYTPFLYSYNIKVEWKAVVLFPGLLQFTLDPYLIILSVKQGRSNTIF